MINVSKILRAAIKNFVLFCRLIASFALNEMVVRMVEEESEGMEL